MGYGGGLAFKTPNTQAPMSKLYSVSESLLFPTAGSAVLNMWRLYLQMQRRD